MDLASLDRKALQTLAKEHGVKANLSNAKIIKEIEVIRRNGKADVPAHMEEDQKCGRNSFENTGQQIPPPEHCKEVKTSDGSNAQRSIPQDKVIEAVTLIGGDPPSAGMHEFFSPGQGDLIRKRSLSPFIRGRGKSPINQPLSQISLKSDNSATEVFEFKPKPMPDFKALHAKLQRNIASGENQRIVKKGIVGTYLVN